MSDLLTHLQDLKAHREKAGRPEFLTMVWLAIDGHLDELIALASGAPRSETARTGRCGECGRDVECSDTHCAWIPNTNAAPQEAVPPTSPGQEMRQARPELPEPHPPAVAAPITRPAGESADASASGMESRAVAPQVPHGVCRADDPNREADQRAGSSTASPQATAPSASAGARGVAPSVSDDSAGTRIPAGAAFNGAPRSAVAATMSTGSVVEQKQPCTSKEDAGSSPAAAHSIDPRYAGADPAAEYARRNPLGGPASVFEAMAARLRSGEDYYSVLDDFGLQQAAAPLVDGDLATQRAIHDGARSAASAFKACPTCKGEGVVIARSSAASHTSPTPRTDEAEVYYSEIVTGRDGGLYWVKADFARQLERELAKAEMQNFDHETAIGALQHDLERAMANHNADINGTPSSASALPRYHCYLGQDKAEFPLNGGWQMKRSEHGAWVRFEDVRKLAPPAASAPEPVAWRHRTMVNGEWGDWRHQASKPRSPADETFQFEPLFSAPPSAIAFSREGAAKIVERKAEKLRFEYCRGDSGPGGYIWTNKEAEWQVILLDELAEEFRKG